MSAATTPTPQARTGSWPSPWLLAPLAMAIVLGVALYPGRWTPDTLAQLQQVRTGVFDDWYGTVLLAAVRGPYLALPHFGLLLPAQLVLLAVGLYGVLRAVFGPRGSALLSALIMAFPPVLGWEIVLSRDVWYGILLLAAAAAIRFLMFDDGGRAVRVAAWACAAGAIVLATGARQNGIFGVVPLIAIAAWQTIGERWARRPQSYGTTARAAATVVATVAAVAVTVGVVRVLTYDVVDAQRSHIERALYIYDLAAVSQHERENLFGAGTLPPRRFESLVTAFDADNVDSILWGSDAYFDTASARPGSRLRSAWTDLLTDHPAAYLRARARLFIRMLDVPPASPVWTYQPTAASRELASPAFGAPNRVADRYLGEFSMSYVQRPFVYLAAIFAFLVLAAFNGRPYRFVGAVALGAVLYILSFFFLATVVGSRFSWIVIVMGLVSAASALNLLLVHWRERSTQSRLAQARTLPTREGVHRATSRE